MHEKALSLEIAALCDWKNNVIVRHVRLATTSAVKLNHARCEFIVFHKLGFLPILALCSDLGVSAQFANMITRKSLYLIKLYCIYS